MVMQANRKVCICSTWQCSFYPGVGRGALMAKVSQGADVFNQVKHKCLKLTLVTKTLV